MDDAENRSDDAGDGGREAAATAKMRQAGQSDAAVTSFASALRRVREGEATSVRSDELEPVPDVPRVRDLEEVDPAEALAEVAIVKLNGGLATSMGLREPKSLLEAREGRSFLDVIVGQTLALRRRHGVRLPLVLMNSEVTRRATEEALEAYPDLPVDGVPAGFLQSMVPKLDPETLEPVSWPENPSLEWNPPGHGDVYSALHGSGMLDALRTAGFRWAMVSNIDNLGATVDARIAGYLVRQEIPFLMEVVEGTEADRKGGHLARRCGEDRLILRETAQTPEDDMDSFTDFRHWRYYNTNTLWIDLEALAERLDEGDGALELPVIVNRKTVDPRDGDSPAVVQLESAMGAAIGSFPGARLLCVPRTRFVPVKTTDDLFVLRSDVYAIGEDSVVAPVPERTETLPFVALDRAFYKLIDDFEARVPDPPPSLREADRLVIHGDVTFESGVVVRGSVELREEAPRRIASGTVLEG